MEKVIKIINAKSEKKTCASLVIYVHRKVFLLYYSINIRHLISTGYFQPITIINGNEIVTKASQYPLKLYCVTLCKAKKAGYLFFLPQLVPEVLYGHQCCHPAPSYCYCVGWVRV